MLTAAIFGGGALSLGAFAASRYRTVSANKFMAKTGPFVSGVSVSRKTFQWPFQRIAVVSMEPINHHFLGNNMSKEYVPFKLPLTFTVGPRHPEKDLEGFINYATRLGDLDHDGVKNILAGIVHGEVRKFIGGMTIPEIFNDREAFGKQVVERVQKDLDKYGVEIQNANIEEMQDTEGNTYFENLKKKALEGANTQSRIEVSEARKEGDIGEKQREIITRKERSILEADAKQVETQQNQKMSDYFRELDITNTTNKRQEELAKIDAHSATETKRIEVESELNKRKQAQELEKLRSEKVVKATAESEAILKMAEADACATKIKAEAQYFAKAKEADGIRAQLEAQASGLDKIYQVSRTNPEMASFYLALEKGLFNPQGLFSVLADKQASAIRGLEPKIHIWSTGDDKGNSYTDVIKNLGKTVPPMLDLIRQQTGIRLPDFMANSQPTTPANPTTKTDTTPVANKSFIVPEVASKKRTLAFLD